MKRREIKSKHEHYHAEMIELAIAEIEQRGNWSVEVLNVLVWLHLHAQNIDAAFRPARVVQLRPEPPSAA